MNLRRIAIPTGVLALCAPLNGRFEIELESVSRPTAQLRVLP